MLRDIMRAYDAFLHDDCGILHDDCVTCVVRWERECLGVGMVKTSRAAHSMVVFGGLEAMERFKMGVVKLNKLRQEEADRRAQTTVQMMRDRNSAKYGPATHQCSACHDEVWL